MFPKMIGCVFCIFQASAVVGTTLTNKVLVSRDFMDESAASSEKEGTEKCTLSV